jgi:hypothetical protein
VFVEVEMYVHVVAKYALNSVWKFIDFSSYYELDFQIFCRSELASETAYV